MTSKTATSGRTKLVHDTRMVAHLWAHQTQDSARNSGSTLYFTGDTIYSYGSHFPIARVITRKGKTVVLFTTRGYSPTTNKHISYVRQACSHLDKIYVYNPAECKPSLGQFKERYASAVETYRKAHNVKQRENAAARLQDVVKDGNEYAEFFGLRGRLTYSENIEELAARAARAEKREEAKQAKLKEKAQAEHEIKVAEWVAGKINRIPYATYLPGRYLASVNDPVRLRIVGETLETSKGAEVPLAHAKKVFSVLKKLRDKGQTYHRNGHTIHLGHFALDSLDDGGRVTAGCHVVEWDEIERIARIAGVL